jgi:SAM-dependent methyltransferase
VRFLDRALQQWRVRKALPWVGAGDRLLDVGCFDRTLLDRAGASVASATGIDPLVEPAHEGKIELLRGTFPDEDRFATGAFDCLTCLAVFEHVDEPASFARECHRVLAPGGRVVLTVPHPFVDRILDVLMFLGLADGMSTEEHHGFDVGETAPIFEAAGFRVREQRSFQLGLNRLFVFEKPA